MNFNQVEYSNIKSDDRVLVLEEIPGVKTKDSGGLVDPRLFKGGNRLHAIMDPETMMWSFKYEAGGLPGPLKQNFTKFSKLLEFAKLYFAKRGLNVARVID